MKESILYVNCAMRITGDDFDVEDVMYHMTMDLNCTPDAKHDVQVTTEIMDWGVAEENEV